MSLCIDVSIQDKCNVWDVILVGIKTTNRMQQLHDFNTVCYEKVVQQVHNGHQVGCLTNHVSFMPVIASLIWLFSS